MASKKQQKACSIIATELPPEMTRQEIENYFSDIGPVKKCHMVRDKDGVSKGLAYIIYTTAEDAGQAVNQLDNSVVHGKAVKVKFSRQRENDAHQQIYVPKVEKKDQPSTLQEKKEMNPYIEYNKFRKYKEGKIIIRNLSFKANEKDVENHFAAHGKISEVSVLRKEDGVMVGCAYVQYSTKDEALKAIQECNMKPLLGRVIAVDLFVPKKKLAHLKIKEEPEVEKKEIKVEEIDLIKKEDDPEISNSDINVKDEKLSSEDDDSDASDYEKDDEDEDEDGVERKMPTKEASNDVAEGRTLFIQNLTFDATEEEVAGVLCKFGELKYVLLCIDHLTEHPRGTAFVQFKEREAADACLAAGSEFNSNPEFCLHGRAMRLMRAISREQLENRKNDQLNQPAKDKRNLYLAREGFVRQGTQSAIGVSKADLQLRMERERVKRRMLKNLHIFVSPTRLFVSNIPKDMGDKQFMEIFKKHAPPGAKITESRIMKNLKELDDEGKPVSRGYGFLAFTTHDHALAAVRNINNNPTIFTFNQRPVVEFSLENRAILKARERRLEKSRENNPNNNKNMSGINIDAWKKGASKTQHGERQHNFMGSQSDPAKRALPTNIGPKERYRDKGSKAKISRKQLKKEQKDRLLGRRKKRPQQQDNSESTSPNKKQRTQDPETSSSGNTGQTKGQGKKKTRRNKKQVVELKRERVFDKMVNKYKEKIAAANSTPNSKRWYED